MMSFDKAALHPSLRVREIASTLRWFYWILVVHHSSFVSTHSSMNIQVPLRECEKNFKLRE